MLAVRVEVPPKLIPVFAGKADYRGAFGGRGSAKTRSFAKMSAVWGLKFAAKNQAGVIVCGREFQNSLDESSMAEVKTAILSEPWLAERYEIGEKYIRTLDRRISFAFIGLRHNLDSIKSKSKIRLLWVDEAEAVSETAWVKTIPTIREEEAEIWVTWNPERKQSPTHKRFRDDPPCNSNIVELNYTDNPWFPDRLDRSRNEDFEKRPEQYEHIWGGDFVTVVEGAYWAKDLALAKKENRICKLAADPLMGLRAHMDLGGTGNKADAFSIWIDQFIGKEIRVLDHYTAQGQPLSTHVKWMKDRGYEDAFCILPHDGSTNDRVHDVSFESALNDAGFETKTIPNQGKGAAKARVEAARRVFPQIWFNEPTTIPGRQALGWYHEKIHKETRVGLGPDHDWSSHDADAFGLMCVDYLEKPKAKKVELKFESQWS